MSKPQLLRQKVDDIIKANGLSFEKTPLILVGIRGYYLDSMGKKAKNDRGIYDDALFWVTETGFLPFNANTDPSTYNKGKGTGSKKGRASLKSGVWLYKTGMHNGSFKHQAFRQYADVIVQRDCEKGTEGSYQKDDLWVYDHKGDHAINIHRGGLAGGTSSLGCQTIPVSQWQSFKDHGYNMVEQFKLKSFPYVLVEETELRKGNLKAG